MQTMYYTTSHFIRHTGNMVDLNEFRQRRLLAQQDNLARKSETDPASECPEKSAVFQPRVLTPNPRTNRALRRKRQAWLLDTCASLGVVIMTISFALMVLI